MIRGEVYWVDFDPSVGGEIRKERPAVILSNDVSNRFLVGRRLKGKPSALEPCPVMAGATMPSRSHTEWHHSLQRDCGRIHNPHRFKSVICPPHIRGIRIHYEFSVYALKHVSIREDAADC